MEYTKFETDKVIAGMENVRMDCARFEHVPGADESFAMLRIVRKDLSFEEQIGSLFALHCIGRQTLGIDAQKIAYAGFL